MPTPKLTLVGAGPGDEELITLKGIRALQSADAVLYDALANKTLLEYCKPDIPMIFVGKRKGTCMFSQAEINQLIVENAFAHGHVVRLKGGDPFIFGRGYEELAFAQSFHIEVHIVPGVSSALAVPALQHIPLTTRGINESVWITTGTTRTGEISQDIHHAAQSSATVVILMAMSKIEEIMEIFSQNGKGSTPAAVIMHGSTSMEKYVLATVDTISSLSKARGLANPAIILVGDVVSLHPEMEGSLAYHHRINS